MRSAGEARGPPRLTTRKDDCTSSAALLSGNARGRDSLDCCGSDVLNPKPYAAADISGVPPSHMTPPKPPVLALPELQADLRKITETLAGELAHPTSSAPDWSSHEWILARAVAAIHGISPLLSERLRWEGGPGWRAFLSQQKVQTQRRAHRIQELLAAIDARMRDERVPFMALKGAVLHAIGLYTPGQRPMADIDLLVHHDDMGHAERALGALGFRKSCANWKHVTFTLDAAGAAHEFGEHSDNPMKIELHERICEILPSRPTDVTALILPRARAPGLNAYPSIAALMTHLLLHAAGAMAYRSVRMLHLHDIALLAQRLSSADWDGVVRLDGRRRGAWWALPPLTLTHRYSPGVIPAGVLAVLRPACPRRLRRLAEPRTVSDVSMSYLWLERFPGLLWAPSVTEALEHIVKRVMRAMHVLSSRQTATDTELAMGSAQFSRQPYILRSLISRTARPETLTAVHAALANGARQAERP
jgi:hypothetical protein